MPTQPGRKRLAGREYDAKSAGLLNPGEILVIRHPDGGPHTMWTVVLAVEQVSTRYGPRVKVTHAEQGRGGWGGYPIEDPETGFERTYKLDELVPFMPGGYLKDLVVRRAFAQALRWQAAHLTPEQRAQQPQLQAHGIGCKQCDHPLGHRPCMTCVEAP